MFCTAIFKYNQSIMYTDWNIDHWVRKESYRWAILKKINIQKIDQRQLNQDKKYLLSKFLKACFMFYSLNKKK